METDFVSEVDRKFFANNMLSNEDWEASMELTELMGLDSHLPNLEFVNDLQLPADDSAMFPGVATHDDLLNDWSDSSDSGVSGMLPVSPDCDVMKHEPLSPTLSHHSDSCDSGISQVSDLPQSVNCSLGSPPHTPGSVSSPASSQCAFTSLVTDTDLTTSVPISYEYVMSPSSHTNTNSIITTVDGSSVNINTILSTKIPIQPKPEVPDHSSLNKSKTVTQGAKQKSLVLTAEEFQRLASQGVLRFEPPKQESILKPQMLPVSAPVTQVHSIPVCSSRNFCYDDKDSKALKRQQRMIKNRESASLSRKRKKEYMSSLECRLKEFSDENEKLRLENHSLKRKLTELHSENETLKKSFTISPTLKKTIVLGLFIMLSLNLGTWSNIMLTDRQTDLKVQLPVHKGRQLMAVQEEQESGWSADFDTVNKLHDLIMEYGGSPQDRYNATDVPPMCPTYFNKTESMRLAEQLAGWMSRHEEKKKKVVKIEVKPEKEKQIRPISTLSHAMRGEVHLTDRKYKRVNSKYNQLQLYEGADSGRDFLKALHRRNDTFYVLSFDEDYYLVPAVYHNKTSRPRMSLVMPAVALNESMMPGEGQVGMMQIDCEVMNTQLIHVQKTSIPRNAREKYNNTKSKYREDYYS